MTVVPTIKREFLTDLAEKGKRADGRAFDQYRPIEIEAGVIGCAEGSARVKIGRTQVIAGIKMDVGSPYPDSPNRGVMTTAAELIPLASPDFESGPPREAAIELSRVVDRGIRESGVIKVEDLCITPGEKIWIVFIDIQILDYDGNLFDACSLAALAALNSARFPTYDEEKGTVDHSVLTETPLPLRTAPISCTSVKIGDAVMVDPSLDEDEIASARITVACDAEGDIRAMQKGLNGSFTTEEIKKVIKGSYINGSKIREQLYKSAGK